MRNRQILATLLAALMVPASAQQTAPKAPAAQAPATGIPTTFKASSNLVILDVTAKDKGGLPIEGLKASDFTVLEDGKARLQPIKVVYAEGADAAVTGIKPGDVVVMDGKQNVRPGSPLVERAPAAKATASAAAKP